MLNGCLVVRAIYFPLRSYQYSRITVKIALHSRAGFVKNGLYCWLNIKQNRSQSCVVTFMSNVIDVITRFLVVCLRLVSPMKEAWQSEHLFL